jgi:hypothetical protein
MQKLIGIALMALLMARAQPLTAQFAKSDSTCKKFFAGSTLFVLANLFPDDNAPDYVQLNLGYRPGPKDELSLEFKTWKYAWPLGIPYGRHFEAAEEKFPGTIREFGIALSWQHCWWKGLFTGLNSMPAFQRYEDEEGRKTGNGFQLFNTYRLGYHLSFFRDRFFLQPSLAVTHRPWHSGMPASFRQMDEKWSRFFVGEPGLHFGINF